MSGRKKKLADLLNRVAYFIEVVISFILLAAVIVLLVELVLESRLFAFDGNHLDFNSFLSKAFNLIIGVEFTKMLCRHTPETVVEVLLFATARQIVISHSSVLDTLIGVLAIAALFAIKKFLVPTLRARKDAEKQSLEEVSDSGAGQEVQTAE